MRATRYQAKADPGEFIGFLASVMRKEIPVLHYWIVPGEVPAFVKFEGPFFMEGPVWRIGSSYRTDGTDGAPDVAATPRARPK
jgi:hypothetical protein